MKLGLIGDIHADSRALDTALRHLETQRVDQLLCTGDLVGYGWQPDAVVSRVRELAIPCVRGNHDRWALERRQVIGSRGWKPATFADETWSFLETLPPMLSWTAEGVAIEVHHGSPANDTEFVTPYRPLPDSVTQFWGRSDASVLVLGHTHLPMIDRQGAARSSTPARSWASPAFRPPTASPCSTSRASPSASSRSATAARSAATRSSWTTANKLT